MILQNDYKVLYEKVADGKRTFFASKSGAFADAEQISEFEIGKYKLVYEKNGKIYCSENNVPSFDENGEPICKYFIRDTSGEGVSDGGWYRDPDTPDTMGGFFGGTRFIYGEGEEDFVLGTAKAPDGCEAFIFSKDCDTII